MNRLYNADYAPYTPDHLEHRLQMKAMIDAARIERQGIDTITHYQQRQAAQRDRLRQLGVSS